MRTLQRKADHLVAWLSIGLAAIFSLIVTWSLLNLEPVYEIMNDPTLPKTSSFTVAQGDTFVIPRAFCVVREPVGLGWVERRVKATNGTTVLNVANVMPKERAEKGCYQTNHDFFVPRTVPPGEYMFTVTITYPVNRFLTTHFTFPESHLTVLPHPDGEFTFKNRSPECEGNNCHLIKVEPSVASAH